MKRLMLSAVAGIVLFEIIYLSTSSLIIGLAVAVPFFIVFAYLTDDTFTKRGKIIKARREKEKKESDMRRGIFNKLHGRDRTLDESKLSKSDVEINRLANTPPKGKKKEIKKIL